MPFLNPKRGKFHQQADGGSGGGLKKADVEKIIGQKVKPGVKVTDAAAPTYTTPADPWAKAQGDQIKADLIALQGTVNALLKSLRDAGKLAK